MATPKKIIETADDVVKVARTAKRVVRAAKTITAPEPPPAPKVEAVKNAASGWIGSFAGVFLVLGSLLLDPTFSKALGEFTVSLSKGDGGWAPLVALLGAGLLAYRRGPGN